MKKAHTWIITCFYLQLLLLNPLVKTQSPCGNPVTDDVNDIPKLVGNLPNDYMIALKYVRKMDTLIMLYSSFGRAEKQVYNYHFIKGSPCKTLPKIKGNLHWINEKVEETYWTLYHECHKLIVMEINQFYTEPNHCWLHLMVPELSKSLNNLLNKFAEFTEMPDVLSNYSIINNLRRIINDLMACLSSTKYKNFRLHHDHLYEEGTFVPEEFFKHFYSTIDVYKVFAKAPVHSDCVLPSTTEVPSNDSSVSVTKPLLLHPVAASHLRNDSSDGHIKAAELGFLNSPSMQGVSIALTSLVTLCIGFILGALCWKKTAHKHTLESGQTEQSNICQEDNEISMLQQKGMSLLQV